MNKYLVVIALTFVSLTQAQAPVVDYQMFKKYTTPQRDAIDVSDTSVAYYIENTDIGALQVNRGNGWVDAFIDLNVLAGSGLNSDGSTLNLNGDITLPVDLLLSGGSFLVTKQAWGGGLISVNNDVNANADLYANVRFGISNGLRLLTDGFRGFTDKFEFISSTNKGIEYNGDYSSGFVARSLIDKGYADANYLNINNNGSSFTNVDADLFDGLSSEYFIRKSSDNTLTGINDFTGGTIIVPNAVASNQPPTLSQMNAAISASGGSGGTTSTINQNRFVCTVNNSPTISESVGIISITNYTDVASVGSIAVFNGSNLTVTASSKDIEIKAQIHAIGEESIDRQFYFRDVNDPINVEFGNGVVTNAVSSYGTYGFNSSNRLATAVVRAGTTVVLNLIHQSSIGKQKVKAGSFIDVKEIN